MVDDNQAQNQPVTDTQGSAMPTEDQKTHLTVEADGNVPQGVQPTGDAGELPEDAKERTRREFEKVRTQLQEERARREYYESVFNSMQPKAEEAPTPIIDPDTGFTNVDALNDVQKRSLEAERRANEALQAVKGYEEQRENREVYQAFPELDPNDGAKHDKQFHIQVRQTLLDSMLNPDDYNGRQLSFMDAARMVSQNRQVKTEQPKQDQTEAKEQVSVEPAGNTGRRSDIINSDADYLKHQTRKGNIDAIVERLKNT